MHDLVIHVMKGRVRAWIQRRRKHGTHHALMQELSAEDPEGFRNFLRMDTKDFQELLRKVTPLIRFESNI
jgi:uncharacterized membrane protein YccC